MASLSANVEKECVCPAHETLHVEEIQSNLSPEHVEEIQSNLSPEHVDYLMSRHGTIELYPVPSEHSADPYNWPGWKVGRKSKAAIGN